MSVNFKIMTTKIHGLENYEHIPTAGQSANRDIRTNKQTLVDTTSVADVLFDGTAPRGAATSDSVWDILKTDTAAAVAGKEVISTWAKGIKWDDRVGATYT